MAIINITKDKMEIAKASHNFIASGVKDVPVFDLVKLIIISLKVLPIVVICILSPFISMVALIN